MKKHIASLAVLALLTSVFAGCVDTTGLKPESSVPARGNLASSVVVTEYSDFECPACRVAYSLIVQPLYEKYKDRVRFEMKQFPLLTVHRYALPLAEASECAADQGKFWEFVDTAFTAQLQMDKDQKTVAPADITTWAQELKLDMPLFDRCTRSHIKRKAIMDEFDAGRKLGVNGTPTFFINGQLVPQDKLDLAEFEKLIDAALAQDANRKL